jgi:transposase-like protein
MAEYLFNEARYSDPEAAREYLESVRWPNGPVCPHCGAVDRISKLQGTSHRPGLYDCGHCRDQFTVTVGTVFERSKIGLDKWLLAASLMAASKKGISSKQVERMLGVTYKTAWFMTHRLREAMKPGAGMFSSGGGTIEADATYVGGKEKNKHASKRDRKNIGGVGKQCVFSLVERNGGVRSFHIPTVNAKTLKPILTAQLNTAETHLMTDGERILRSLSPMFASHQTVSHERGEYVRGDVHSNTVEGYFSILKRGIIGTFHHVSPQHLQRYATEFDFRYNHREMRVKVDSKMVKAGFTDAERTDALLRGIAGKRITYRPTHATA